MENRPTLMERIATFTIRSIAFAIPVVMLLLYLALGPTSFKEATTASAWFFSHRFLDNLLLGAIGLVAVLLTLAWLAMALWQGRRFRAALARGEVPARQVGAIDDAELVRMAKAALGSAVRPAHPRVERVLDALMGTLVDLGATQLSLTPNMSTAGGGGADVSMQVAMERLPIIQLSDELHRAVAARLALMIGVEKVGAGQVEFRSGEIVESIEVRLMERQRGTAVELQIARRGGFSRKLDQLGMSESVLHRLDGVLDSATGLILVAAESAQARNQALFAIGHRLYEKLGKRAEAIASLESRVEVAVPFMVQVEVGAARPEAVFSTLIVRDYEALVVRDIETAGLAKRVLRAAQQRIVVASIDSTGPIDGLMRLDRLCRPDPPSVAETVALGLGHTALPTLCECASPLKPSDPCWDALAKGESGAPAPSYRRASGCERCQGLGLSSVFLPLYWVVEPLAALRQGLADGVPGQQLQEIARQCGATPLEMARSAAEAGRVDARDLAKLAERRW